MINEYAITGIKRSTDRMRIIAVEIRNYRDKNEVIGIWSIDSVIKKLLDNKIFITATKEKSGWRDGSLIHIVTNQDKDRVSRKLINFSSLASLPLSTRYPQLGHFPIIVCSRMI